jgi:DNA-binding transcriptional ArsR family regulator
MARQSVSKHLAILEDANLVTTPERGQGPRNAPGVPAV